MHRALGIGLLASCSIGCGGGDEGADEPAVAAKKDLVFVANEDTGSISVIEEQSNSVIDSIDLPMTADMYMPHNVQVAPDGKSVWVVAPPMTEGGVEKVFIIDPASAEIVGSVDLGQELHVAHVVFDPSSSHAYVTANEGNAVLEVDSKLQTVSKSIDLGVDRGPHGIRWCRDRLYVANMTAKSLSMVEPASGSLNEIDVGGVAVQTACTPDAKFVFVSLYDTKEVVRYEIDTQKLVRIALPAESQGPVQLYPSPDSATLWVCDQGILEGRPASNKLYRIAVTEAQVTGSVDVGTGAHGVVVSDDGALAYVTNLSDDSVSVVDTMAMTAVATIPVGTKPNGISHWHSSGGMP